PWHRMPFRLSSTSSRGMRLRSSSFSIVNRGQSLEYEQQAPHELQAPIGRHVWDLCSAILSTESPSLAERSRWTKSPQLWLLNGDGRLALGDREAPSPLRKQQFRHCSCDHRRDRLQACASDAV